MSSATENSSSATYQTASKLSPAGQSLAALIASCCNTLLTYPLDLVSRRFQAHDGKRDNVPRYKSTTEALRTIVRQEGALALYQGASAGLIGAAVAWAAYFFFYAQIKQVWGRALGGPEHLRAQHIAAASLAAGMGVQVLTNPIWVLKTRMQLQLKVVDRPYRSLPHALQRIVREEGVSALYRGLVPGLWSSVHGVVQFVTYENAAALLLDVTQRPRMGPDIAIAAGGLSKLLALVTTYPLSVVKTRLQERRDHPQAEARYRSLWAGLQAIVRGEGYRGLYKGLGPSLWRLVATSALFFGLLEQTKNALERVPALRIRE